LLGIPNFWNVVSNLPFIAVGAAVLRRFRHDPITIVIFLGIFLTGFGSSYYHWAPNDDTLFWDRLPMTLFFMAILAATIEARVNARAGAVLLWPLLAVGVFSLLLWRWTDDLGSISGYNFFPVSRYRFSFSCTREIYRSVLLGRRRGALRTCQVA
jgi:Ceramidase